MRKRTKHNGGMMNSDASFIPLIFDTQTITARFIGPSGQFSENRIEVRTNPVTGRVSRVTYARIKEREAGTETLPPPPPEAHQTDTCPFCYPQVHQMTPGLHPDIAAMPRLKCGSSLLFPNLFPYGQYSGVSLFDDQHFVEIGTASLNSYVDCFLNCRQYLRQILSVDSRAIYMAITQNHLPSAGGSLVHPHLQVHADAIASNHHRFLLKRCEAYYRHTGQLLFSDYLEKEQKSGDRYIGHTGDWHWAAAFAPEGFFEIWGILPGQCSMIDAPDTVWHDLSRGVLNTQKFYRSLCRNGYNLGLLCVETPHSRMELRCVILARSNYNAWVRNDHTSYEVMLGDMATFSSPEQTAEKARKFWKGP